MTTGTEGPHYDVTREALIEALGGHPLTATLNTGARGRFADVILGQMPEATATADMLFEQGQMAGVRTERRRAARLAAEILAMRTGCDAFRTFTDMLRDEL